VLNLATRHEDGEWIIVCSASKTSFSINVYKITAGDYVNAFWIDPKTGVATCIDSFPNRGVKSLSTPDEWEDAILILEKPD